MKLAKFEEQIREALNEAVQNAIREEENDVTTTIETADGYVDVSIGRNRHGAFVQAQHDSVWHRYNLYNLNEWVENIAKEYSGAVNWLEIELEMLDDVDTSDEAEYYNPGITRNVCRRADEIRRRIDVLKRAQMAR